MPPKNTKKSSNNKSTKSSTKSTSIYTQDNNVNISEIISDTTVFAMSTDIANRSTINDQLESIQVPVDIHVDKNQSIENEDIHVDIHQSSTQSEESHVEPSSKPLKRKKA